MSAPGCETCGFHSRRTAPYHEYLLFALGRTALIFGLRLPADSRIHPAFELFILIAHIEAMQAAVQTRISSIRPSLTLLGRAGSARRRRSCR